MEYTARTRNEILSKVLRTNHRTYFFDVKETREQGQLLTLTESIRRRNDETGQFYFEKHKIFIDREEIPQFRKILNGVLDFMETGIAPEEEEDVCADGSTPSNLDFMED
jgi:hypothetical protein